MAKTMIFAIASLLLLIGLVIASDYEYKYSPYTGRQDRSRSMNQSGNLTIGENIKVDGYLHIGENGVSSFFTRPGDLYVNHTIFSNQGVLSRAENYGIAMMAKKSGGGFNMSGTASFTANGIAGNYFAIICDSDNPFEEAHEKYFFTVSSSTDTCPYGGATGEIKTYINSTCVEISVASAGLRALANATGCPYSVYTHPIMAILDRGTVGFHIGKNKDANFHIEIEDGRGFHGVYIDDVAGADQHQALTVDVDIKDYDGVVALNIFGETSTGIDGIASELILLESDATGINNSELVYIKAVTIGEGGPGSHVDLIKLEGSFNHIIHQGSIDTLSSAYVESVNQTYNFTTSGEGATMFENNNEYVYIGNEKNFTTTSFSLFTPANKDVLLEYYYCNTSNEYETLGGITDTTDGMQKSGSISFINPSDRGVCNTEFDGTPLSDTVNYTYIALKRTLASLQVEPVESLVTIGGSQTLFLLQSDMIKLEATDNPEDCEANTMAGRYFDLTDTKSYECDGTSWVALR